MPENHSQPLNFSNQRYFLEQAKKYHSDPSSLDSDWLAFFQGVEFTGVKESDRAVSSPVGATMGALEAKALFLIEAYKRYGHLLARFNPMIDPIDHHHLLSLERFGITSGDLHQVVPSFGCLPEERVLLSLLIERLRLIYCSSLGYECYNLDNHELEEWFHQRVQAVNHQGSKEDQFFAASELYKTKALEDFLQKKFLGAKRFSLEGGEAFIPMLLEIFDQAAASGATNAVIGMAHRGRLNVLANVMGKPYATLFREFNTSALPLVYRGKGDVKYHKGYTSTLKTRSGKAIDLSLAANPSHLESVDPVMMGMVKALQNQYGGERFVLPIMVHGDASIAGQGVVYESMQLSQIHGYTVGGSIHIIINNQIGFTATPEESRSTRYCSDIAKAFGAPVIHVNGEDPIACLEAARIAFETRSRFGVDVFIDMNCHRLYGHNEGDEPRFTNPKLYQKIKDKEHLYKSFKAVVQNDNIEEMEQQFNQLLEKAFDEAKQEVKEPSGAAEREIESFDRVETGVELEKLRKLGEKISFIPSDFTPHPKIKKIIEERGSVAKAPSTEKVVDWAIAEMLAYASLVDEGNPVRLSGQDAKRGTFSHRHAVLVDQEREVLHVPLAHIRKGQATFEVYSSALSEYAVMGYEFGYSLNCPKGLIIWEGQFGDFANGAQIIIDQYLAGCETKWGQTTTMALFLPHGHEGMGPEHTSCRLERFLQLAGLNNWRVCSPSSPAQLFHILRRQVLSPERKPVIITMPKSGLRLQSSYSTLEELSHGGFKEIIEDDHPKGGKRLLLCTGKIYHELAKAREEMQVKSVNIVRIEQLYPLHKEKLEKVIQDYKEAKEIVWVQEEPRNQGAFEYLEPHLRKIVKERLFYVGRDRSSVPDTGFASVFKKEQQELIERALKGEM